MASYDAYRTPEQLRHSIVEDEFDLETQVYLRELWRNLAMHEIKVFCYNCGITFYELARAMHRCNFHHWCNVDFVNLLVPGYRSPVPLDRFWDIGT